MKVAVKERNRDHRQAVTEKGTRHDIRLNVLLRHQQTGLCSRDGTGLLIG